MDNLLTPEIGKSYTLTQDAVLGMTIKKGTEVIIIKVETLEPCYQVQHTYPMGGVSIAWAYSKDLK